MPSPGTRETAPRNPARSRAMRALGRFAILFACCFLAGACLRLPAMTYPYFCWDEHDYIAHNIYARTALRHFEVPYSNKWPLGHGMVYLLTRPWNPFSIVPYRIAMLVVDSASAALVGLWLTNGSFRVRLLTSLLYLAASSVCLRISPGIIVENMANLPLIAAGCVLMTARNSSIRWSLAIFFLAAACLVKPTAALPGLGLICGQLWFEWKYKEARIFREVIQIAVWSLIFISFIIGLYWLNTWNAPHYFWRSAVIYNALNNSILRNAPLRNYADVFLTGFAFFQYLTPALVFGAIAIIYSQAHQVSQGTCAFHLPL
jgi:hypothetical protein